MADTARAFAGSIPEKYERFMGPWIFEPFALDLVAHIHTPGIKTVLETACGTGRVTGHLRTALPPDARLVATDLNADMFAIARQIIPDQDIEWQTADAQALPFEDSYFDMVVCQFGLMFMPDKAKALAEACRVLKPGGRLLMSTWDKLENNPAFDIANQIVARYFPADPPLFFHVPFSLHDERQLASWVKEAGFGHCSISRVKKDCRGAGAADIAAGMLEGTPVYTAINERDASLLPAIKKDLAAELARQFGDAPMVSPMQAWIIEAGK